MDTTEVNAQPIVRPITYKEKFCKSLEKSCKASFEAATLAGVWPDICKSLVPTSALEIFCIKNVCPEIKTNEAAIVILKRVKRHLVFLNTTVLEAYEKRNLAGAVFHVTYQDANFNTPTIKRQPEANEAGWESRMDKAQTMIDSIQV